MMARPRTDIEHGTNSGYHKGCRCAECRIGHRDYNRELRSRGKTERRRKDTKLLNEWSEQYNVPRSVLRDYSMPEWEQLMRMEEHARATIFSTWRWEKGNPDWRQTMPRNTVNVERSVPLVVCRQGHRESTRIARAVKALKEDNARVRRMMDLATGKRRVA